MKLLSYAVARSTPPFDRVFIADHVENEKLMVKYRKKRQFDCLELPDLDSFDEDEKLLAQVIIGIVRRKGALFYGRLIEVIVARLLGARFPRSGISRWDLLLPDNTRIEVRSGDKSFSLKGKKDVDLWVFVHKSSPDALFSVATADEVAALNARGISATRLASRFPPVGASDLEATVAAVRGGAGRARIT